MYSGLESLKQELTKAAANTTLSQARRTLALELLEKISESQVAGFVPTEREADAWLEPDVMPMRLQIDIWTCCSLGHRWWNDPSRPKYAFETATVTVPSVSSPSVPTDLLPVSSEGLPAEFGHE